MMDFYSFLLPISIKINDEQETHEDIIAAFRVLDEEQNDYITTTFMYECLTTLGEDLEDFEIELLIKMSDPTNSGRVAYTEFVEKMMGISRKSQKDKKK